MVGRTNTGGGGSGGTLTVTGIAGHTVTATKDSKTYTRTFNSGGVAVFKGLSTGTWTVKMSGNGQTATKTIEITADYAITIAFFSASINITYPANSNCVVANSGGQTVASDTNTGTSAKTWTATVNAKGTYTVTATATDGSGKTKSTTVSITAEGQVETVTLSYELVIYEAGVFGVNSAGTQFSAARRDDNNNASSITQESSYMLWKCGTNSYCMFYISPQASCAGYKTLNISVTNASMTIDTDETGKGKWGLSSSTNVKGTDFVAVTNFSKFSGSKTLTLDVSDVGATEYYVAMQFGTPVSGSFSARVTKIWLE